LAARVVGMDDFYNGVDLRVFMVCLPILGLSIEATEHEFNNMLRRLM
jgi:hypothetical protein